MKEPLIIGIYGESNYPILHEISKVINAEISILVNAGIIIIEDSTPIANVSDIIAEKLNGIALPDPIAYEDISINKKRTDHLAKCQPWKRHKKGRGK